jgi:hypothetical protein
LVLSLFGHSAAKVNLRKECVPCLSTPSPERGCSCQGNWRFYDAALCKPNGSSTGVRERLSLNFTQRTFACGTWTYEFNAPDSVACESVETQASCDPVPIRICMYVHENSQIPSRTCRCNRSLFIERLSQRQRVTCFVTTADRKTLSACSLWEDSRCAHQSLCDTAILCVCCEALMLSVNARSGSRPLRFCYRPMRQN